MIKNEAYKKYLSFQSSKWAKLDEKDIMDRVADELGLKETSNRIKSELFEKFHFEKIQPQ